MNQIRTNTNFAKKQNPQTYLNNDKYNNPKSETSMQGFSWWVGGELVGSLSTTQKIGVSSMSHVPHCFEPKMLVL